MSLYTVDTVNYAENIPHSIYVLGSSFSDLVNRLGIPSKNVSSIESNQGLGRSSYFVLADDSTGLAILVMGYEGQPDIVEIFTNDNGVQEFGRIVEDFLDPYVKDSEINWTAPIVKEQQAFALEH